MIVFAEYRKLVQSLIVDSIDSFSSESPDVRWSCFALYACPWAGWIVSCFDTEERSNQVVAEFAGSGPDWYGQDNWGSINFNCPDFQFFEWRTLDLSPLRIEYEGADPIHIRDLSGKDHFIGSENEAINGLAFEFLRTVMHDEIRTLKTKRASMFLSRRRFGIQLLDSTLRKFWHALEIGS